MSEKLADTLCRGHGDESLTHLRPNSPLELGSAATGNGRYPELVPDSRANCFRSARKGPTLNGVVDEFDLGGRDTKIEPWHTAVVMRVVGVLRRRCFMIGAGVRRTRVGFVSHLRSH
jgi:hypothetical protein